MPEMFQFHGRRQCNDSEQLACEQAKPQHKSSMPPVRDGNEKEEGAPMPNHVYNSIEFSNEDDARRVWEECSCEVASPDSDSGSPNPVPPESLERRFAFNSLIPMPDALADAEESSDTHRAIAYALYSTDPDMESARDVFSGKLSARERYRVDDAWESLVASGIDRSEQENLSKSAAQYARNLSEHGHLTWYTWAYANWNTKWNAYESSLYGRTISFTTAWCAPTPVFEALIARYPDVPMSMSWYEEQGIENTGEIISDGKGSVWYYQGGQSERAAGIYARLTGAEHVLYDVDRLVAYQEEDFEDDPEYFEEEGISRENMEEVEPAEVGAAAKGLCGLPFKAEHFEAGKRLFPR